MSFAISWLKKENYPFEKYKIKRSKSVLQPFDVLELYLTPLGKSIYGKNVIYYNLPITLVDNNMTEDEYVYFNAIKAYKELENAN